MQLPNQQAMRNIEDRLLKQAGRLVTDTQYVIRHLITNCADNAAAHDYDIHCELTATQAFWASVESNLCERYSPIGHSGKTWGRAKAWLQARMDDYTGGENHAKRRALKARLGTQLAIFKNNPNATNFGALEELMREYQDAHFGPARQKTLSGV